MRQPFQISLPVTIRLCRAADLLDLEWFGVMTEYRQTIREAYRRSQEGEVIMLVAEANRFPVAQVWIDLVRKGDGRTGYLWSLRVLIPFQNLGIGTHLIVAAEDHLRQKGFRTSEIAVEKDNPAAKRLYKRLGYEVVGEETEEWSYTPPGGEEVKVVSEEWVLQKGLG